MSISSRVPSRRSANPGAPGRHSPCWRNAFIPFCARAEVAVGGQDNICVEPDVLVHVDVALRDHALEPHSDREVRRLGGQGFENRPK